MLVYSIQSVVEQNCGILSSLKIFFILVHQYVRSLKDGKDLVDRLSLSGSKVVSQKTSNS